MSVPFLAPESVDPASITADVHRAMARLLCAHRPRMTHAAPEKDECPECHMLAAGLVEPVWRALKYAATGSNAQRLTIGQAEHVGAGIEAIEKAANRARRRG